MPNGAKKFRGSNWSHEETVVLAELKKETFLKKQEGRLVWEEIAQKFSRKFPVQNRSHDQCRRRWETLTKIYKHIENYCVVTAQDHSELDEDELSSMKLDTAYRQDWYDIVKQVCSQRKRKVKDDGSDLTAVKRSKVSDTCCSRSKEPTWSGRDLCLCTTTPLSISNEAFTPCEEVVTTTLVADHEQSSLQVEKSSSEEENRRLWRKIDALSLEVARLRQHTEITPQDQVLQKSSAEIRAHVKEPLQDTVQNWREVTVERSSMAAEQDSRGCGLINICSTPESFSDGQRSVGMNLAAFNSYDPFDSSTFFSTALSFPTTEFRDYPCTWIDGMRTCFRRIATARGTKGLVYSTSKGLLGHEGSQLLGCGGAHLTYSRRIQKARRREVRAIWLGSLICNYAGTSRLHRRYIKLATSNLGLRRGEEACFAPFSKTQLSCVT